CARAVHTPHILASRRLDTPPLRLCICRGRREVRGGHRLHTAPGVTRSTYRRNSLMRHALRQAVLVGMVALLPALLFAHSPITWTVEEPASEAYITGGPWTLEQAGASQDRRAAGYCDHFPNGVQQPSAQAQECTGRLSDHWAL